MMPLDGLTLDELATVFGFMRYRRFRRDWRFLWLRWRPESDREFAARVICGMRRI